MKGCEPRQSSYGGRTLTVFPDESKRRFPSQGLCQETQETFQELRNSWAQKVLAQGGWYFLTAPELLG